MTSRISRSASIPIPSSNSAARNIENVISIPFTTSATRPRMVSNARLQVGSTPERPAAMRVNASSPARSLSGSYASTVVRSPTTSVPVFEPRHIRATTGTAHTTDPACVPASAPTPSAPRMRRPSIARVPNAAPIVALRTAPPPVAVSSSLSGTIPPPAPTFPRPAYLDHSALRDFLHTDVPSLLSPPPLTETAHGPAFPHPPYGPTSRMGTPVPAPAAYPYLRREHTPNLDTDDESTGSPSPPSVRDTPAPVAGALLINQTLRLPTRWSEQDRHPALTVSNDGRDLTFYGTFSPFSFERFHVLTATRSLLHRGARFSCCSCQLFNPSCMRNILLRSRDIAQGTQGVSIFILSS